MRSAPVRAVAPPGGGLDVRVAASTGCELLIELSVLAAEDRDTLDPARRRWAAAAAAGMPAGLRRAVGRVGDRPDECRSHGGLQVRNQSSFIRRSSDLRLAGAALSTGGMLDTPSARVV